MFPAYTCRWRKRVTTNAGPCRAAAPLAVERLGPVVGFARCTDGRGVGPAVREPVVREPAVRGPAVRGPAVRGPVLGEEAVAAGGAVLRREAAPAGVPTPAADT